MNTTQRQRLAALRRMADHPGTPEHERESARRRIDEMELKYGAAAKSRPGQRGGAAVPSIMDMMRDMMRDLGIDPDDIAGMHVHSSVGRQHRGPAGWRVHVASEEDFRRATAEPPFHHNARCHHEPVGEPVREGGYAGKWVVMDYSRYCAKNEPGPYGRVDAVEAGRDQVGSASVFAWKCPVCGDRVTHGIPDHLMMMADLDGHARRQLGRQLFARWNGESDNRCSRCSRFTDAEPVKKKTAPPFTGDRFSEFADYVMRRWRDFSKGCDDQGPYGRVAHVARHQVTDDSVRFQWPCRSCGRRTEEVVDWREAKAARLDHDCMEKFLARLFRIWTGYHDNRCEDCRKGRRRGRAKVYEAANMTVEIDGIRYDVRGTVITPAKGGGTDGDTGGDNEG